MLSVVMLSVVMLSAVKSFDPAKLFNPSLT
jgi:hypothetical protein